ncbi:MAG: hypothetical protein EPO21_24275 [Chloroflexota bacterium]|nr:MAG: hypothetical protein EPO21_24275 [Chloroflexota bacterium]
MSLFDILFGRTKPVESKIERLFAIATAQVSLETMVGLVPAGSAGICFKPVTSSQFQEVRSDLEGLLKISSQATRSIVRLESDAYGFTWVVVEDDQFEDLVSTVHACTTTLQDQGFGGQILAAVFRFRRTHEGTEPLPGASDRTDVYWIYNYKRGKFYPFAPRGTNHDRDNAMELRLGAVMQKELPIEPETDLWYALWGLPV